MRKSILAVSPFFRIAASAAAIALAGSGCSGQVFSSSKSPGDDVADAAPPEDSSPARDSSPASDGSPAPDSSLADAAPGPCPATTPPLGTGCAVDNLMCESGQSEYPGCDTIVQCSSGAWQVAFHGEFCPGPNPAVCPPSMTGLTGQSCQPGSTGELSCFYPNGGCYCGSLGGPVPIELDGSYPPQQWQCDDPGPDCAVPRPRLGSSCAQEGQTCQYLQCDFAQACTGGVWVDEPEGCAQAGGGANP